MDLPGFSIGCRACRETDDKRWRLQFEDEVKEEDFVLANRSDFGVMRLVERIALDRKHACPFCGSAQLEFFDLAVNDQLLFAFDALCRQAVPQGLTGCVFSYYVADRWEAAEARGWVASQQYTCRGHSRAQALAVIASVSANLQAGAYSAKYS